MDCVSISSDEGENARNDACREGPESGQRTQVPPASISPGDEHLVSDTGILGDMEQR